MGVDRILKLVFWLEKPFETPISPASLRHIALHRRLNVSRKSIHCFFAHHIAIINGVHVLPTCTMSSLLRAINITPVVYPSSGLPSYSHFSYFFFARASVLLKINHHPRLYNILDISTSRHLDILYSFDLSPRLVNFVVKTSSGIFVGFLIIHAAYITIHQYTETITMSPVVNHPLPYSNIHP